MREPNNQAIDAYMEAQSQNPSLTLQEFLDQNPDLRSSIMTGEYDNEWISFMSRLADNKSVEKLTNYIKSVYWTDRQKRTIMAYAEIVLGSVLSTTNFPTPKNYRMFQDDKALIDCDLTVGMTRFDITPEFNILLGLINYHVNLESRKSIGALFIHKIGLQSHEIIHEERNRDHERGFRERISDKLGFGGE